MDLVIYPRRGVGEIGLGMSRDAVILLLGRPDRELVRSRYSWAVEWMYDDMGIDLALDRAGTCAGIGLTPPSNPSLRGVRLLEVSAEEAWGQMLRLDPSAVAEGANLTSHALGVSIYAPAILDDEPGEPAESVLVFREDYFDLK